ncbi:MAG TPA: galactokinase family protein [Acidimicrobiales bacterium]|nr:galactokinase family protein [Acidimicrobiales bacterium]
MTAPGRVNLIGEHTDYNGGLAAPMAVDRAVEVVWRPAEGRTLRLHSDIDDGTVELPAGPTAGAELGGPRWARLACAVVAEVGRPAGGTMEVTSTLPAGVGLSSSAAFCVAVALALGSAPEPWSMAELCARAESAAGTPVGLMDPLVSMAGRAGHLLRIDFATRTQRAVPVPDDAEVAVVDTRVVRDLETTPYADRRRECEAAAALVGRSLGLADAGAVARIADPTLRARARHVVSECRRVDEFLAALVAGDLGAAGRRMLESHGSLAGDFAASTPAIDALVEGLTALDGVYGARLCGGGFGGNVVVLCRPGSLSGTQWSARAQVLRASNGATRTELEEDRR